MSERKFLASDNYFQCQCIEPLCTALLFNLSALTPAISDTKFANPSAFISADQCRMAKSKWQNSSCAKPKVLDVHTKVFLPGHNHIDIAKSICVLYDPL